MVPRSAERSTPARFKLTPLPRIVAGCVADLWKQYQAVGAQDLVLIGRIEQPDDVQRYRDALPATSLVVCRLRTSSEELRERILARTRGDGPPLAGDALVGLAVEDAEIVLQHSLAQQGHLEELDFADITLDTAEESPEVVTQSVRAVFDRWLDDASSAASTPNTT